MGLHRATLIRFHQEDSQCSFSVSCSKTSFSKIFHCNKAYKASFQVFLREAQNYLWVGIFGFFFPPPPIEEDFVLLCCFELVGDCSFIYLLHPLEMWLWQYLEAEISLRTQFTAVP